MTLSVYVCFLLIGSGLLTSSVIESSAQDVPHEELCTPMAISGCYVVYEHVFWDVELRPNHDGHFNNTAYHLACRQITAKSPCHKTNENCPQKATMDLTRQEKGYQLLRDFVCDFDLFKDFQRCLSCEDHEEMRKCMPPPPQKMEQAPFNPNGEGCRNTIDGWVCREKSLRPDCWAPYKRCKESYSKVREAVALLTGCDYDPSAFSSEAPHSVTPSSVASPSATASSEAPSPEGQSSAGQPSAAHPSMTPSFEMPTSEGPSSTRQPSVAPPSLAPPSVAPWGLLFYIASLALLRLMNSSG